MIMIAQRSKVELTFNKAFLYCLTLNHRGYKDWRMPSWNERLNDMNTFAFTWDDSDEYDDDAYISETFGVVPVRDVND